MCNLRSNRQHLVLAAVLFALSACDAFAPDSPPGQEIEITTVHVHAVESGSGFQNDAKFSDPDGLGGEPPSSDGLVFRTGKSYSLTVSVLDERSTPSLDLTERLKAFADEVQVFYHLVLHDTITVTIPVDILDHDAHGFPIGFSAHVQLGDLPSINGRLDVSMYRYARQSKDGVQPGDRTLLDVSIPVSLIHIPY